MDNKDERILAGTAFIGNGRKAVYNPREIRRGKHKGKLEVWYRKTATKWRTAFIRPEDVYNAKTAELNYDNPCPLCGKWLFHDSLSPDCPNQQGDM